MTLKERLDIYEKLMRLDKPIGSLLLMWPTLWALWLSGHGFPPPHMLGIFVLGVVLMRSAGCVINDIVDRKYDVHVDRTKERPLAVGQISSKEALLLAGFLVLLAFLLVLFLNRLAIELSFVALLVAVIYPFLKRFFSIPQAWLGIAFGFGIPMAYAAQQGMVPLVAWVMLIANIFWVIAYDTEYAMVDRDDDLKLGLRSSAILFGRFDVLIIMICHAVFLFIMASIGLWLHLGMFYYLGVLIAAGLAAYQFQLIRNRDRQRCFKAFLDNNMMGAAIFAGILLDSVGKMFLKGYGAH